MKTTLIRTLINLIFIVSYSQTAFASGNLLELAFSGNIKKMVKYLAEEKRNQRPIDFNRVSNSWPFYGFTPLGAAVLGGNPEMVEFLIGQGARTNQRMGLSRYKKTPLDIATEHGDIDSILILIKYGTNANSRIKDDSYIERIVNNNSQKVSNPSVEVQTNEDHMSVFVSNNASSAR